MSNKASDRFVLKKGMGYSEYQDLMPIDDVKEGSEYLNALRWAFGTHRIKNIALTAPYGAGKSSIINAFLKHEKCCKAKNVLKISMATVFDTHKANKENLNKVELSIEEIEKGILKQLFYKIKPSKIPQSRYRKLRRINYWGVLWSTALWLFVLGGIVALLFPSQCRSHISLIHDTVNCFLASIGYTLSLTWKWGIAGVSCLLFLGASVYLIKSVITKFKIKEVRLGGNATASTEPENKDTIFNRNLDEIIYFFEVTDYRTVFFEDLDRLENAEIFVHLRELNNLLNNDDAIKDKPIVFVYAVKDDIFTREERTKFFDFIIPVIPVINGTNSSEVFLQKLKDAKEHGFSYEFSDSFIRDVFPYVSDMRLLQNIYNEFVIYKNALKGLSLIEEKILALIIFKNLHPKDFADIQHEGGVVKEAFKNKYDFVFKKQQELQEKVNEKIVLIDDWKRGSVKSVKELKYVMIGMIVETSDNCPPSAYLQAFQIRGGQIPREKFMEDEFDMNTLVANDCRSMVCNNRLYSIDIDVLKSYVQRWQTQKRLQEEGLEKLQTGIAKLNSAIHLLPQKKMVEVLADYSTQEVLSEEVRKNDFLTFALRRGYIDETYANYINYFKEGSITSDDMKFILSIKNQRPLPHDYQLTKTKEIVRRLQGYEFGERAARNCDLLKYLLETKDQNEARLSAFMTGLSDGEKDSWSFIELFFTRTSMRSCFIQRLSKSWSNLCSSIVENNTLGYDRQLAYVGTLLSSVDIETVVAQNIDSCLTKFFEAHDDVLQRLSDCNSSTMITVISKLDVRFRGLQTAGIDEKILVHVFENCHYQINEAMIKNLVEWKNPKLVEGLESAPYSTVLELGFNPLTQYIHDNIVNYVQEVLLSRDMLTDKVVDMTDTVKRLANNTDTDVAIQLICKETNRWESVDQLLNGVEKDKLKEWKTICDSLLFNDKLLIAWGSVISYWKAYGMSDELKRYLSEHADRLVLADSSEVGDDFIKALITSGIDNGVVVKLLPQLRMKNFDLDISSLDEAIVTAMVECDYFDFTPDRYAEMASQWPDVAFMFILKNPVSFMKSLDDIGMSEELYERLLSCKEMSRENRQEIFVRYAEEYMNERIAINMVALGLYPTDEIFNIAWNCVGEDQMKNVFMANIQFLGEETFGRCFADLKGEYGELADRSHQHVVTLMSTPEHMLLANRLKEIGYITSVKNVTEKSSEVLKLRIRPS